MIGQSRKSSLVEALVNVLIGLVINFCANIIFFPLFGWHIDAKQNITLGGIYTVISIIRSYTIRRWFNAHIKRFAERVAG
jgi:hypothetical protein